MVGCFSRADLGFPDGCSCGTRAPPPNKSLFDTVLRIQQSECFVNVEETRGVGNVFQHRAF
jgi:hypothetical protein